MDQQNLNQNNQVLSQQPIEPIVSTSKHPWKWTILGVFIMFCIFLIGIYLVTANHISFQTVNKNLSNNISNSKLETDIYFGTAIANYKEKKTKYYLVSTNNGKKNNFIPDGYELSLESQFRLPNLTLPKFMILEKENEVYAYSLKNNSLQKIIGLKLTQTDKTIEELHVKQSVSEKDKFLIIVYTLNALQGQGDFQETLNTRSYLYDASINNLKSIKNILSKQDVNSDKCLAYDSFNQRFFVWKCTTNDSKFSAPPISILDLNGNLIKEIISQKDFPQQDLSQVYLHYNNGEFFLYNYQKIMVLTPSQASSSSSPEKLDSVNIKTYVIDEKINDIKEKEFIWSIIRDENNHKFILAERDVKVLSYSDVDNRINTIKTYKDKEVYNFYKMLVHNNKLYYVDKNSLVKIINLDTLNTDKIIPTTGSSEIGIFSGKDLAKDLIPNNLNSPLSSDTDIAHPEARSKVIALPEVQDFLNKTPQGKVVFDHEDQEKNTYVIHVYEDFSDHQATFNWYYVNKITGIVTKEFSVE